jgi:antitoxin component of MazEF toxin-antitoxin module
MIQHLQRLGDQFVLVIEPALAAQAGLAENSEVEVAISGKTIVIAPLPTINTAPDRLKTEDEVLRRMSE